MVEVPTSKLRFACASCSEIAVFCAPESATLSCARRTSKYACAARRMSSVPWNPSAASACSTCLSACEIAIQFWMRITGCVRVTA